MDRLPDDVKKKIEARAKETFLLTICRDTDSFIQGAEFGYLLSVDKEMESEAIAYQDTFIEELKKEIAEGRKEIERLEFKSMILEGENRQLRCEKLQIQKDAGFDPYWYWPQCDVEGCEQVSCCGGICWRDTGYWSVCPDHSDMHRRGEPQPQMKQSAIDKEKTRGKDGVLPSPKSENNL